MTDKVTESRNPKARGMGVLSTRALLELMNEEDATVPAAVRAALPSIERATERIVAALSSGGRLRYAGAGTSGRLGVLDASEMPPTFGTDPDLVRGIIAGGDAALRTSVEGAEDDAAAGEAAAREHVRAGDVLVGISASGGARYVVAAVRAARAAGAGTVGLTCVPGSDLARAAEIAVVVETGAELLAGSTRLKAGTATKLVLNMLTTAAMIRLGRTTGDLMTSLRPTNDKLRDRAARIVALELGVDAAEARRILEANGWSVREALDRQR